MNKYVINEREGNGPHAKLLALSISISVLLSALIIVGIFLFGAYFALF